MTVPTATGNNSALNGGGGNIDAVAVESVYIIGIGCRALAVDNIVYRLHPTLHHTKEACVRDDLVMMCPSLEILETKDAGLSSDGIGARPICASAGPTIHWPKGAVIGSHFRHGQRSSRILPHRP